VARLLQVSGKQRRNPMTGPRLVVLDEVPFVAFVVTDDETSLGARAMAAGALKMRFRRVFFVKPGLSDADLERHARAAAREEAGR
jgi:hypothetical protein